MPPDHPLLRAILADPDDDTRRLAAADWFAENDRPDRAEFVRVQVELARGVDGRDRRIALERRQRDLLVAHEAEWAAPLAAALSAPPRVWAGWVFRRGFPDYFRLPAAAALARGREVVRVAPVRALCLTTCFDWQAADLAKHHWVRGLTHLYLPGTPVTDDAARALMYSPFLDRLRVLAFARDAMTPAVAAALRGRFPFAEPAGGWVP